MRPTTRAALGTLVDGLFGADRSVADKLWARITQPAEARKLYDDVAWKREVHTSSCDRRWIQNRDKAAHPAVYQAMRDLRAAYKASFQKRRARGRPAQLESLINKDHPGDPEFDAFVLAYPSGPAIVDSYVQGMALVERECAERDRLLAAAPEACEPLLATSLWRESWRTLVDPTVRVHSGPPRQGSAYGDLMREALESASVAAVYGPDHESYVLDWHDSGWESWQWNARIAALTWRYCRQHGWEGLYRRAKRDQLQFLRAHTDDDVLTTTLDDMVADVDRVRSEFEARCRLCVRRDVGHSLIWFGGLSAAGHLVGAVTFRYVED